MAVILPFKDQRSRDLHDLAERLLFGGIGLTKLSELNC